MSEHVPEEDPEPLSGGLQEFINTSIADASHYSDDGLATYYRELEQQQQEKKAVGELSVKADGLFQVYEPAGDSDDQTITCGEATLRRRREVRSEADRPPVTTTLYFFNDNGNEAGYCRVWTSASDRINWCYNEQRHEPAVDVQLHLLDAFPPVRAVISPRRFGKLTLPRIIRQKV